MNYRKPYSPFSRNSFSSHNSKNHPASSKILRVFSAPSLSGGGDLDIITQAPEETKNDHKERKGKNTPKVIEKQEKGKAEPAAIASSTFMDLRQKVEMREHAENGLEWSPETSKYYHDQILHQENQSSAEKGKISLLGEILDGMDDGGGNFEIDQLLSAPPPQQQQQQQRCNFNNNNNNSSSLSPMLEELVNSHITPHVPYSYPVHYLTSCLIEKNINNGILSRERERELSCLLESHELITRLLLSQHCLVNRNEARNYAEPEEISRELLEMLYQHQTFLFPVKRIDQFGVRHVCHNHYCGAPDCKPGKVTAACQNCGCDTRSFKPGQMYFSCLTGIWTKASGNVYACRRSGAVHVCGDFCRGNSVSPTTLETVCTFTGVTKEPYLSNIHEKTSKENMKRVHKEDVNKMEDRMTDIDSVVNSGDPESVMEENDTSGFLNPFLPSDENTGSTPQRLAIMWRHPELPYDHNHYYQQNQHHRHPAPYYSGGFTPKKSFSLSSNTPRQYQPAGVGYSDSENHLNYDEHYYQSQSLERSQSSSVVAVAAAEPSQIKSSSLIIFKETEEDRKRALSEQTGKPLARLPRKRKKTETGYNSNKVSISTLISSQSEKDAILGPIVEDILVSSASRNDLAVEDPALRVQFEEDQRQSVKKYMGIIKNKKITLPASTSPSPSSLSIPLAEVASSSSSLLLTSPSVSTGPRELLAIEDHPQQAPALVSAAPSQSSSCTTTTTTLFSIPLTPDPKEKQFRPLESYQITNMVKKYMVGIGQYKTSLENSVRNKVDNVFKIVTNRQNKKIRDPSVIYALMKKIEPKFGMILNLFVFGGEVTSTTHLFRLRERLTKLYSAKIFSIYSLFKDNPKVLPKIQDHQRLIKYLIVSIAETQKYINSNIPINTSLIDTTALPALTELKSQTNFAYLSRAGLEQTYGGYHHIEF